MSFSSIQKQVMSLIGELSPEETASLAGAVFAEGGVSRDTINSFVKSLPQEDRDELLDQLEGVITELEEEGEPE